MGWVSLTTLAKDMKIAAAQTASTALPGMVFIKVAYGYMSVRRAITMSDPALGCINPKDDHTVHPIGYFAG